MAVSQGASRVPPPCDDFSFGREGHAVPAAGDERGSGKGPASESGAEQGFENFGGEDTACGI